MRQKQGLKSMKLRRGRLGLRATSYMVENARLVRQK